MFVQPQGLFQTQQHPFPTFPSRHRTPEAITTVTTPQQRRPRPQQRAGVTTRAARHRTTTTELPLLLVLVFGLFLLGQLDDFHLMTQR